MNTVYEETLEKSGREGKEGLVFTAFKQSLDRKSRKRNSAQSLRSVQNIPSMLHLNFLQPLRHKFSNEHQNNSLLFFLIGIYIRYLV
jgi:hypothetical protein